MFRTLFISLCFVAATLAARPGFAGPPAFSDPTRPPSARGSVATSVQQQKSLQSILYSNTRGRSLAIINGKTYAVGERSPLGVINSIDRDGITVAGGNGQRVVKLHRDLNKQMVAGQ